jgi:anti-anti-sigma factor
VSTARSFTIREAGPHDRRRLRIAGELDVASAEALDAALCRLCGEGIREIEVDLREIDFIDSSGLRAILLAKDMCAKRGTEFFLVPGEHPQQRRLFEITGVLDRFRWRRGAG